MLGRNISAFRPRVSQVRSLLKPSSQFGSSIILLQDGPYVQELPVLVRNTSDHSFILKNFASNDPLSFNVAEKDVNVKSTSLPELSSLSQSGIQGISEEEQEFVNALMRTERVGHIYRLLETATIEGITPFVALRSLVRIAQLESREGEEEGEKTFARQAVIQKLMRTVLDGSDYDTLVNTFIFMKELQPLGSLASLCEELQAVCIDKASAGHLSINQIICLIRGLTAVDGPKSPIADQLWQGIQSTASQIDETNVGHVCSILPLLKHSCKTVFHTIMDQLPGFWWKLSPDTACEVMDHVSAVRLHSSELCRILVCWTSLSLHQLDEAHLQVALAFFCGAGHCDDTLARSVDRYCRARGRAPLAPATVAAVAAFALRFRVRSEVLLETVSDHFVAHQARYGDPAAAAGAAASPWRLVRRALPPPTDITAVVRALGELGHQPRDRLGFFAAVERRLAAAFADFPPEQVLDVCLACVYLQRYPLNFFRRVFNPSFLERLPAAGGEAQRLRAKLSVLDAALTAECPGYQGPMLPRDMSARSVARDARAARLAHAVAPHLAAVPGVRDVEVARIIPQLPLHPLYVPDLTCTRGDGRRLCLFLNPPELYERGGARPLGALRLRARQLRRLQLAAVDLPLRELAQLVVHPAVMRKRLADAVAAAAAELADKHDSGDN